MTQQKTRTNQEKPETRALARWEDSGVPTSTVGMARAMVKSGYFADVKDVSQAIVKIEMGKELGITPVEAMQYLHIFVTGRGGERQRTIIQLGYPLVGALIQRSGKYHFDVCTKTDEVCEIDFYRILEGGATKKLGTSRFTMEKARAAGLVTKDVWKAWPDTMLYARALTHGARTFCPEILGGAGVASEAPYIEGTAQLLNENGEPPVVEEPPEGFTSAWSRFWTFVKESRPDGLGLTEEQVHAFFGVESLKQEVERIVAETGKTEAEVVAEFEFAIREAQTSRQDITEETRAVDAEEDRAGITEEAQAQDELTEEEKINTPRRTNTPREDGQPLDLGLD